MSSENAQLLPSPCAQPEARRRKAATTRLVGLFFDRFTAGTLSLELPSGEQLMRRASSGPEAAMKINSWRTLRRLITRGDIGFAEGFMEGDWTTPDLVALLAWIQANETSLTPAWQGRLVQRLMDRLVHLRRSNTRRGSRRNIAAHYDLGNDFYAAWLDPSLSYSSAIYRSEHDTLEAAQQNKIDRVCELLEPSPGMNVLEIGCGWGALADTLISRHGCSVTGLTLSREQKAIAESRVARADPSGASAILLQDYRDTHGQFDRIASIEMMEAAGEAYWPDYFAKIHDCLKPGGVAVVQVISIEEKRFEDYRRRPDFIQRYIFPGGMLPTVTHMHTLAAGASLHLDTIELFGKSYARTLLDWRTRFLDAWPAMQGEVRSTRFRNMWEYYMAYCAVGFDHGSIDVGLYRLRKAG